MPGDDYDDMAQGNPNMNLSDFMHMSRGCRVLEAFRAKQQEG